VIQSKSTNIQSGWKLIFSVFSVAACDESEYIVSNVFEIIDSIVKKKFHLISGHFFVDLVNCLAALAQHSVVKEISIKSIHHIKFCADYLADGNEIKFNNIPLNTPNTDPIDRDEPTKGNEKNDFKYSAENETHLKYWLPILSALSHTTNHLQLTVRNVSLKMLFTILRSYGQKFDDKMWKLIFGGENEWG
jgi:Sec7-like guanine-nucleotide exchange factor